jgi:hypothetical protein
VSRAERAVFGIAIGMGAVAYLVLALGLLKLLRPALLWGAVGLAAIAALVYFRPKLTLPKMSGSSSGIGVLLVAIGFGLVGLATLAGAIAPPTQWDEMAYHLAVPKVFLREGRIFYIPYDHHSNFPFTLQMLYTLMLSVGAVWGAKLIHWLCGLLLVISVGTFCKRHFGDGAAIAAGAILASPLVLWEATTAYIDLGTTLYVWLAFYGLMSVGRHEPGKSLPTLWLLLSALCMGFALGTKATVLGFWGLMLIGFALRRAWKPGVLWGSVSLGVGLVWYIKSWLFAGNPVYPFAYSILGGRYWSAENAAQYAAEQGRFGFGKDPLSLLLSPFRVSIERFLTPPSGRPFAFTEQAPSGIDFGFVWLIGLILALVFWKKLPTPAKYAGALAGGMWLFWFFTMQQGRYLLPALPLFAVLIGAAYAVASKPVRAGLAAVVVLGVGWSVWSVQTARLDRATDLIAACQAINASAAPADKVAIFDENRGFYLEREYIWAQPDHAEGLIPWDSYKDADEWLTDFKRRGYVWFLNGPVFGEGDGRRWRQLFAEALESGKIIEAESIGRFKVYRVP